MGDNSGINAHIGHDVLGTTNVAGGDIHVTINQHPQRIQGVPYLAPQLPPHHVPRIAELNDLYDLLVTRKTDVAVTALRGMGGIGKTTLAIALCHDQRILDHFTDGVLWAELGPKGDPARAQGQWLEEFGVSPAEIPDPESRATRLRAILQSKRCLLVIDDVWDSEVLPLLQVGGSACATLVTTRERKIAQIVGTARELDVLKPEQAVEILQQWAGEKRDDQKAGELAKRLGYLPLAMALAGAQAQDRRTWDGLLTALRDSQGDITLLDLDDPRVRRESLALTFKASLDHLEKGLPERFCALGVFAAGREAPFSAEAAAAVWGIETVEAEKALGRLMRAALLERTPVAIHPEREYYMLHMLLGDFARGNLQSDVYEPLEMLHREYYFDVAKRSNQQWREAEAELTQMRAAWERLLADDLEGWYRWATLLDRFMSKRGYWVENIALYEIALKAARTANDHQKEARSLAELGYAANSLGRLRQALEYHEQSLVICREVGDRAGEATAFNNIGRVYSSRGDLSKALDFYEQGLEITRELGDRASEATSLNNIGYIHQVWGDLSTALDYYQHSLVIRREVGDRAGSANTLNNIGGIYDTWGDLSAALEHFEESLVILREVGDRAGVAHPLNNIGGIYQTRGDLSKALDFYEQGLEITREMGNRASEATSLNNIGFVYSERGDLSMALEYYEQCLVIQREIGNREGEATSLNNIGFVYSERGDLSMAFEHYEQSLVIQREIGSREGKAQSLNNIGGIYQMRGDLSGALEHYEQSLAIWREVGDRAGEAITLNNIGRVYSSQGDLSMALEYYEQSLDIQCEVGNRAGEALTGFNIAAIYRQHGRLAEAVRLLETTVAIDEQIRHPDLESDRALLEQVRAELALQQANGQ